MKAMIPAVFEPDLPESCRQVLLVLAPAFDSVTAELNLLERDQAGTWQHSGARIPVVLGRSGLAWGLGEHTASPLHGWPMKREGDGCSPAGVFRLPLAFGEGPPDGCRLPWVQVTETLIAVDDPNSRFYNQIVDSKQVTKDWISTEFMRRDDELYRLGLVIAHNPANLAGAGSCIFMHLWRGENQPTAGCTAMSEENLRRLQAWIDPAQEPRLVQWVA